MKIANFLRRFSFEWQLLKQMFRFTGICCIIKSNKNVLGARCVCVLHTNIIALDLEIFCYLRRNRIYGLLFCAAAVAASRRMVTTATTTTAAATAISVYTDVRIASDKCCQATNVHCRPIKDWIIEIVHWLRIKM